MSAIQTYTYKIRSYHTNASGGLFIHQLLNFLQDAAHNHADGFGFGQNQLASHNLVWVLSRLNIEIASLPVHGEIIELSTWVKSIRGSISEREFKIKRGAEILVSASSLWFCLSTTTHKPARVPTVYTDLMQSLDEFATEGGTIKVEDKHLENNEVKQFEAMYSDIDMVDHVNNATYARWALDELRTEVALKRQLKGLLINYTGQCFLGDKVEVVHSVGSDDKVFHQIRSISSLEPICLLQSHWQN